MAEGAAGKVGFRPLYQQVQEAITAQLAAGRWAPGAMLPSEVELARELGVSQGTVRKALDAMTADRILVRRQGRGTFVAEYEESRILFQFFRLYPDSGERLFPDSQVLAVDAVPATPEAAARLDLPEGALLWRIERLRTHADELLLSETLLLPQALFAGLGDGQGKGQGEGGGAGPEVGQTAGQNAEPGAGQDVAPDTRPDVAHDIASGTAANAGGLPNNLYQFYAERWGITVTRISEQLKAVAAGATDAARLQVAPGTPLLEVRRVAYDLQKRAVEYRRSRCLTLRMHYASDLG